MKNYSIVILAFIVLTAGCAQMAAAPAVSVNKEYAPPAEPAGSFFKSDQSVLGNDEIDKILNSRIVLPPQSKIAVLRFAQQYEWFDRFEEYSRFDTKDPASFMGKLSASQRIREVAYLPSLLTPKDMTVPYLREAAARVQADLLLVYRISKISYSKQKAFSADETKAMCVVDAVLLDVRTGIVPFSTLAKEVYSTKKVPNDMNFSETVRRAEEEATNKALARIAMSLAVFLNAQP